MISFPRLQAIRYPCARGEDVVYGLRLTIPSAGGSKSPPSFYVEAGKIPDDSLKSNLVGQYVGLADNFWFFTIANNGELHTFLASLFLADLISREEAEAVLAKGPHHPHGQRVSPFQATIHRLPSVATLGGAFWGGSHLATEFIASSSYLAGIGSSAAGPLLPVAAGCLAVGGAALVFGRTSRAGRAKSGEMVPVPVRQGVDEAPEESLELVPYVGGRRRVDTRLIHVLSQAELTELELFQPPDDGWAVVDRRALTAATDDGREREQ